MKAKKAPSTFSLPGFSLLEIAMVLCIIGIIGGFALPALTQMMKQQKVHKTEQHLSQITQALASYVLTHKRLPCAAPPGSSDGVSENGRVIGLVPYRTLGLPEAIVKDGYRHWITYAVVPELTNTDDLMMPQTDSAPERVFCEISNPLAEIKVHDAQGRSVVATSSTGDFIAFVLVSHGPKGEGSFTDAGNRRPTSSHDKAVNAADDLVFVDRPPSAAPDNFFDDTVRWVTRNNLMAIYGQKPCQRRDDANHSLD